MKPEGKSFLQRVAERQGVTVQERREPPPTLDDIYAPSLSGNTDTAAYVQAAIDGETSKLAAMPPKTGRNHQLNKSAFSLRRFIDNGSVDEQTIYDALMDAANACGIVAEDGEKQCEASIRSGFRGSTLKVGAKPIPETRSNVTEVAAITFDPKPEAAEEPARLPYEVTHLDDGFWQSRDSLRLIYEAALGRMCAPWAVLAHCVARALLTVRPYATLPPLIGGPGSLNCFSVVVAPSGGGKSAAADVARELVDVPVELRSLGSGEGFLESFHRPENKQTGEPAGHYQAIMFMADESDTVSALGARSGSTLLSTLRTAWTGGHLSFGYRGRTNDSLAAHSYRATLVMAMQPSRSGWMLDDDGGGTPQRFMWFPGVDPRISREAWSNRHLASLVLPSWREWEYSMTLEIPDEARDLILREHAKRQSGAGEALDGHALFCRLKFAYGMTVLDGRVAMTEADWHLSGVAARVSTHIRDMVQAELVQSKRSQAADLGVLRGVVMDAADNERATIGAERVHRVLRRVLDKLDEAGGQMSNRDLSRVIAHRDRAALKPALAIGELDGLIESNDTKKTGWRKL